MRFPYVCQLVAKSILNPMLGENGKKRKISNSSSYHIPIHPHAQNLAVTAEIYACAFLENYRVLLEHTLLVRSKVFQGHPNICLLRNIFLQTVRDALRSLI